MIHPHIHLKEFTFSNRFFCLSGLRDHEGSLLLIMSKRRADVRKNSAGEVRQKNFCSKQTTDYSVESNCKCVLLGVTSLRIFDRSLKGFRKKPQGFWRKPLRLPSEVRQKNILFKTDYRLQRRESIAAVVCSLFEIKIIFFG